MPTAGGSCRASLRALGREPRTAATTGSGYRQPAQALLESHLAGGRKASRVVLKRLVAEHAIEHVTPHDLRRTCLTWITRLGFGRDAMDRVANHKTSKVTDVYDRHGYGEEDKRIMAAVARHLWPWSRAATGNVISLTKR